MLSKMQKIRPSNERSIRRNAKRKRWKTMKFECDCCIKLCDVDERNKMVNGDELCNKCCDYILSFSGIVGIQDEGRWKNDKNEMDICNVNKR